MTYGLEAGQSTVACSAGAPRFGRDESSSSPLGLGSTDPAGAPDRSHGGQRALQSRDRSAIVYFAQDRRLPPPPDLPQAPTHLARPTPPDQPQRQRFARPPARRA